MTQYLVVTLSVILKDSLAQSLGSFDCVHSWTCRSAQSLIRRHRPDRPGVVAYKTATKRAEI